MLPSKFIIEAAAKIPNENQLQKVKVKSMSQKEQPIGICDLCFVEIPESEWYTKAGKVRLHCSTVCRNTANARTGSDISRRRTLERMAAGEWVRPDLINKPTAEAIGAGVSRRRKKEVAAGTWRNPSQSDEARKKLSRPRVHGDNPLLKGAISKLTAGRTMADLSDAEAEEYRAYRRRLWPNQSEKRQQRYRERQAAMTDEEREAQRAKWRERSRARRKKKKSHQ